MELAEDRIQQRVWVLAVFKLPAGWSVNWLLRWRHKSVVLVWMDVWNTPVS